MTTIKFGGLDKEHSSLDRSLFAVLCVPYDLTATYKKGSRHGPLAILKASTHLEGFDEELQRETYRHGIYTHPLLDTAACAPHKTADRIRNAWSKLLTKGKIPVMLGGEHSISVGAVKAAKEHFGELHVLQFDAHCDLRDSYRGTPLNHACVARRLLEMAPVTQVGIRSLSAEEHEFLSSKPGGLKTFFAHTMRKKRITPEEICRGLSGNCYISFDVDALDPAIMPSTGTPEPGGLDWHEATAILRQAVRQCNVIGFDINELCPQPGNIAPDFLAAKLAYRIMGYIAEKHGEKNHGKDKPS